MFENAPIGMDECMTPMWHELTNIVENYCWHIDGNRRDGNWWRFYVHFIIYGRDVHNAVHSNRKKIIKMRSIRRFRKGHVTNIPHSIKQLRNVLVKISVAPHFVGIIFRIYRWQRHRSALLTLSKTKYYWASSSCGKMYGSIKLSEGMPIHILTMKRCRWLWSCSVFIVWVIRFYRMILASAILY